MLIAQNRKIREGRKDRKAKAKARRRAMRAIRPALLVLIVGLLFFFVYKNVDYFLTVADRFENGETVEAENKPRWGERVFASAKAKDAAAEDTAAAPPKQRNIEDILGEPVFSSDDRSLLTHMSSVLHKMDTAQGAVQIVRAFEASAEEDDDYEIETDAEADIDVDVNADLGADIGIDVNAGNDNAALDPAAGIVPSPVPEAAVKADTADYAPPPVAATTDTAVNTPLPVEEVAAAEIDTVPAAVGSPEPVVTGKFLLADIDCRLADRDDLLISVSVELFYDSAVLRDEVNFKRGTLAAIVGNVIRGYEYGDVALPSLRADLLNSFNRVLREGALTNVNIQNFRVERAAFNNQ